MSDQKQPFNVFDPKAVEIIQSVLDGKITPQEGASRIISYWSPIELLHAEGLPMIIQTRGDSLSELDRAAIELSNQGRRDEARRLGELNWVLAKRFNDQDLMVQCASGLAQVLIGDPAATGQRLALLEFAVPLVVQSNRAPFIKAVMLAHLADARFSEAMNNPGLIRAAIEACQQALSINAPIGDFWFGRLNYIAGTSYNSLGGSIENLKASIDYLRAALKYYRPDNHPDIHASALNTLGHSYRDLGQMTGDRSLLQEALACYENVSHVLTNERYKPRILENIAQARKILDGLGNEAERDHPPQPAEVVEAPADQKHQLFHIKELIRTSDDALYASIEKEEPNKTKFLKSAATDLVEAMRIVGRDGEPTSRAEILHRLALLFLESTDDDTLWMGLCFASATQRLSKEGWKAVSQARVAGHRGLMLMKIGYPNLLQYLLPAATLLREALPLLQQYGHPGEGEQASLYLRDTDHLLATSGASESRNRVIALHTQEQMQRLKEEAQAQQPDELQKAYRAYLHLLLETAAPQLSELLGVLGLEAESVAMDGFLDEYNRAQTLIEVAVRHRDIGDLQGALSLAEESVSCAQGARYSAPSIWCQLAEFYGSLPLGEEALHCIEKAQELMTLAVKEDEAVLPDDDSGGWIPEYSLEAYQEEIERVKKELAGAASTPRFDPIRTAQLLAPENESLRLQLQQAIERGMARANPS